MTDYDRLYIDGSWVTSASRDADRIPVDNPATGEVVGHVPKGVQADVDAAVDAARRAFGAWSTTAAKERAEKLRALSSSLRTRVDELATVITGEVGTPIRLSAAFQVGMPISVLDEYGDLIESDAEAEHETIGNSAVIREPAGVVAAITPWNYPLAQIMFKLAPALAAGCTLVLKPSEVAPGAAILLFEAIDEAGFPAGVANLVTGDGSVVGPPLVTHPDVDLVSFTGSVTVGASIAASAAASIKRVTLELGGKSASVVLDDGDLEAAVKGTAASAFVNSGQTCAAWTRLVVPRAREDEAASIAAAVAASFAPGDPSDRGTRMGPLASALQKERVLDHLRRAIDDGARLVAGGPDASEFPADGHFVAPTVFAGVDRRSALAQQEVFGPVLAIIPHDGDADAVDIANDSEFGLDGAVWSADRERALAVARRIRTGSITINGGAFNPSSPFGGYKKSGYGREKGIHGLREFQQVKSIQL